MTWRCNQEKNLIQLYPVNWNPLLVYYPQIFICMCISKKMSEAPTTKPQITFSPQTVLLPMYKPLSKHILQMFVGIEPTYVLIQKTYSPQNVPPHTRWLGGKHVVHIYIHTSYTLKHNCIYNINSINYRIQLQLQNAHIQLSGIHFWKTVSHINLWILKELVFVEEFSWHPLSSWPLLQATPTSPLRQQGHNKPPY